jgi:hypothetical protein
MEIKSPSACLRQWHAAHPFGPVVADGNGNARALG